MSQICRSVVDGEMPDGHDDVVPPCIDVYSIAARRDHPTINQFLSTYVDVDQTGPLTVGVLPLGYVGPVGDLPLEHWDEIELHDLHGLVALVISEPARAFTVYLPSPSPWCGAILCCARTGEITYGVSVDDPDDGPEARSVAADLLRRLCETTGAARGWAVWEEPPSVDPQTDRPWELARAVAHFAPGKQRLSAVMRSSFCIHHRACIASDDRAFGATPPSLVCPLGLG